MPGPNETTDPAAAKRALFLQRLREEAIRQKEQRSQVPPLRSVSREQPLPLSFSQEGLWFIQQMAPDSAAYNIPAAYRLQGKLDVPALKRSIEEIVARHEVLRTTFAVEDGEPFQVIAPELPLEFPVEDLRPLREAERERRVERLIAEDARHPFDLAEGPLLRASLFHLTDEEYVLSLMVHHIVYDAWSMEVFWRELEALYDAFSAGHPSPLQDPPIQYADFAVWQRDWLQNQVLEDQLRYWKEHLGQDPPVLELPVDRPRPTTQSFHGEQLSFPISPEVTDALKRLSRQEGATLFMTMLAAFNVLLCRYAGQEDIVVGTPAAGRNRIEIEGLLGFFVNTLAIRTDLSGDPTFREVLGRVRDVTLEAQAHQDVPFYKLVEELQLKRDQSYNPMFQVMFAFQSASKQMPSLPGLKVTPLSVENGTAKFDLTLFVEESSPGLQGMLEYDTDLFATDRILRMAGHLQALLEGIVSDPDQRLSQLSILPDTERRQLLVDFARTPGAPTGTETVVELFEAQVAAQPHHPAVVFEDQSLTYAELDHRANQLARYLQELGVGPETLVGLCVERAPEMMVGLLGILKAGGAYVPLDPTYPPDRVAFMLADSEAPVVLTQARLTDQLPDVDAHVISLDADWPSISGYPEMPPDTDVSDRNLAYVIYTSGSTGTPKGVQVEHRALANHIRTARDRVALGPDDRVLQFMSISFDAAAEEIYPCLASGATLVLRNDAMLASIPTFVEQLRDWGVTMAVLPTAFWHQVVTGLSPGAPEISDRLRLLIVGGERMLPERVRTWKEEVGRRVTLINAYGPTEATVVTTRFNLAELAVDDVWEEVPIGRPIPNLQVYLLDAELQLVPIGVPGELCVGGAGVARGYLNRPALTAERFVPDPFDDAPGARLYRTGDLARYLPDGNIEFLGRVDHQVKVRGFRIELGAIETVLRQHPAVRDVVVLAREDVPGDKRLVAYVVFEEQGASVGALRSFVKDQLPAYMVPSAFISMEAFSLTPNGKVDRRALPAPDLSRPELERDFAPPRSEIERQLVEIWEELLDVEPIGVRDDFFELGGHSLLAVRLTARVEEAFGVNIPLTTIFQEPTIEQLTRHVAWQQGMTIWPPLVAIQPKGSRPPFFCVHPLCGDVVSFTIWSRYLGDDQPFYGLRARGLDGVQDPITEVEAIAADYVDELRTVQPEGPYTLGGYAGGGVIAFEMAQQLRARGEELALLLIINEPPPNSRYHEFSLRPRTLLGFVRNLPPWLREFLRLRLAQLVFRGQLLLRPSGALGRLAQRVQPLGRVVDRLQGRSRRLIDEHNRALLDRDNVPRIHDIRQRRIAMLHQEALRDYTPRPYPGRVTVFRTRRQPLFCSFDPELGWGALAGAGVDVRVIPGSTASVLKDPDARALAEALRRALAEARQAQETQSQ